MKTRRFVWVLLLPCLPAFAQFEVGGGLLDNCKEIEALTEAGEFAEAKEKANLCLQGIEQKLSGEMSGFFLEEIAGWERTSMEQNQAMGFSNISATYEKGRYSVDVSLSGSSGGGFGGLMSGLAQAGLMGGGARQVKVGGIPSTLNPDGTLMVPLEKGSILMFESPDFNTADEAIEGMGDLINDFPVADINAKLK